MHRQYNSLDIRRRKRQKTISVAASARVEAFGVATVQPLIPHGRDTIGSVGWSGGLAWACPYKICHWNHVSRPLVWSGGLSPMLLSVQNLPAESFIAPAGLPEVLQFSVQ